MEKLEEKVIELSYDNVSLHNELIGVKKDVLGVQTTLARIETTVSAIKKDSSSFVSLLRYGGPSIIAICGLLSVIIHNCEPTKMAHAAAESVNEPTR